MSGAKELGAMPANPMPVYNSENVPHDTYGGLTIRQRFAMAAMQGLLANPVYANEGPFGSAAVYHADDLLAELAKEPQARADTTGIRPVASGWQWPAATR